MDCVLICKVESKRKVFPNVFRSRIFRSRENHRICFEQAIEWSLTFLQKDDRIIWYLSILQRFAFLKLFKKRNIVSRKLSRKMTRKLKILESSRVIEDFETFSQISWEHFASVQAVYSNPRMMDYPFYEKKHKHLHPKAAKTILADFENLERELQGKEHERFCNDGEVCLEFDDGWAWFLVERGYSRQEAMAMRHCGNGNGIGGDKLYSLREPIMKPHKTCWKPHLTFILREGLLGR